jgi:gluconokinase
MGVSGSGKSTLGCALAEKLGWQFLDADDYHPIENVQHMASGQPLTDAMREPWMRGLEAELLDYLQRECDCVLAFSGLRRTHRQRLQALGFRYLFLHLSGPPSLIAERLALREGHFMPLGLQASQLQALEVPDSDENVLTLDITQSLDSLAASMEDAVSCFLSRGQVVPGESTP